MKRRKLKQGTRQPQGKVPSMPTIVWDMGATGLANRTGLVPEQAGNLDATSGQVVNPNGVMRFRRVDMLEIWNRRGKIGTASWYAAVKLRDAYSNTERTPGWPDNDRVQSSPKPDHAVTIQIDRLSAFISIYGKVAAADRPIIDACVLHGETPAAAGYKGARYASGLKALDAALGRLAGVMGWRV